MVFSYQGCDGITETSASTSIGLILAAMNDQTANCAVGDNYRRHVEVEVEREVEPEPAPEGQLFPESQVETVAAKPKEKANKEKGNCLRIRFKKLGTKINEAWGGLYDSIIEE